MESDGILGHRAAGLGGGLQGGGERRGGGALMGSGMPVNPARGPQEALACGLALGRAAAATVRWADRLREGEAFPMWRAINPPTPPPTEQMFGVRGATCCGRKQTKAAFFPSFFPPPQTSNLCLGEILLTESVCGRLERKPRPLALTGA